MDLSDHIPQPEEEMSFADKLHLLVEADELEEASDLISTEMITFFYMYANDPILFGLLKLANHVIVDAREGTTVQFNTKQHCMNIPHRVAHRIVSMHDIACFLLIERARIIVNRSVHTYMPRDMDITQVSHKAVFELALSCWSIALARCFCSSILPEKLYAPYSDTPHNLMHGLAPDSFSKSIEKEVPSIASMYLALYNQGGQEMYHAALDRMAATTTSTISFVSVLNAFWEDLRKDLPTNEQIEEIINAVLVANPDDGEDDKPVKTMGAMKDAGKSAGKLRSLNNEPVVDIDVESDLDQYISEFLRMSNDGSYSMHGAGRNIPQRNKIRTSFDDLQHSVMIEASHDEDDGYFGSLTIPEHPTMRDLAMYTQGYPPMLWETKMSTSQRDDSNLRYALYFDISGSMFSWFPVVRALIRILGTYLHPDHIYGFSNQVVPIDLDVAFLRTTGGTTINCATDHARATGITHVIMITDMGDYEKVNTKTLEHLILIATDTDSVDLQCTVFSNPEPETKLDVFPIQLKDVLSKVTSTGNSSFNPTTDTVDRSNSINDDDSDEGDESD